MARRHNTLPNGSKFGSLSTLMYAGGIRHQSGQISHMYKCRCVCGKTCTVSFCHLRTGHTASCGCLKHDGSRNERHGAAKKGSMTPEYRSWSSLRNRCNNPRNSAYSRYGGRGIKCDPAWDSFEAFLIDMGERPSPKHSLDRIDNEKGYSKNNCRWATKQEQSSNRQHIRMIKWEGTLHTLSQLAWYVGIKPATLRARLKIHGWSLKDAVNPRLKVNQFG